MGAAWLRRLGEPLPSIFPGRAEQTGAYRLLSNDAVRMEHILESHFEQTVERCGVARFVLAVQDTTTLDYDGLSKTSGLDSVGGGGKGSSGILAHFGVAVNAVGRPLGMFAADSENRSRPSGSVRSEKTGKEYSISESHKGHHAFPERLPPSVTISTKCS